MAVDVEPSAESLPRDYSDSKTNSRDVIKIPTRYFLN